MILIWSATLCVAAIGLLWRSLARTSIDRVPGWYWLFIVAVALTQVVGLAAPWYWRFVHGPFAILSAGRQDRENWMSLTIGWSVGLGIIGAAGLVALAARPGRLTTTWAAMGCGAWAAAAFLWFLIYGCITMETSEEFYPTYTEAHEAGLIGPHKWIPGFIPKSSSDIRITYDLDTNEIWLRFRHDPEDMKSIMSTCEPEGPYRVTNYPRVPCRGRDWWPSDLTVGTQAESEVLWCGQVTGKSWNRLGYIVIDRERRTAYYWEHGS